MNEQLDIISKALEKIVLEAMRRDEAIVNLEKHIREQDSEIEELHTLLDQASSAIVETRSQLTTLRGDLSQTNNRVELVTYENAHESHLDTFMQEEAQKAAVDLAMTGNDIARGMQTYQDERVEFGMGKFGDSGPRKPNRFSSAPSHK